MEADSFKHTHLGFYLVGASTAAAIFYDSAQVRPREGRSAGGERVGERERERLDALSRSRSSSFARRSVTQLPSHTPTTHATVRRGTVRADQALLGALW